MNDKIELTKAQLFEAIRQKAGVEFQDKYERLQGERGIQQQLDMSAIAPEYVAQHRNSLRQKFESERHRSVAVFAAQRDFWDSEIERLKLELGEALSDLEPEIQKAQLAAAASHATVDSRLAALGVAP